MKVEDSAREKREPPDFDERKRDRKRFVVARLECGGEKE